MNQYRVGMTIHMVETFEHVTESIDRPAAEKAAIEAAERQYPDASEILVHECELLAEGAPAPVDPVKLLTDALLTIYYGSTPSGRWLTLDGSDDAGSNKDDPDDGFYNFEEPPAGYNDEGWANGDDCPHDPPLQPAEWHPFTAAEQRDWLETIAHEARRALITQGIDPEKTQEPEPPFGEPMIASGQGGAS